MNKEETEDFNFLLNRCGKAGSILFTEDRDTGQSSNSIVSIAYGLTGLDKQILPRDGSDLRACENMFIKLPAHRKTNTVCLAISKARRALNE